jgi:hypothetical protein
MLGKAALLDNRKVTKESAIEFAAALDPMTAEDARAAIEEHRRTSTEWLMPAHINQIVAGWKRERFQRAPLEIPPQALADNPQLEIQWIRRRRELIADGIDPATADHAADAIVGISPTPAAQVIDAPPPEAA